MGPFFSSISLRSLCFGFFLLALAFFFARAQAVAGKNPGARIIEPGEQYRFAENYFEKGQYFKAIAEFERFIHFFPEDERLDDAFYKIGESYFNSGRFKEAIAPFSRIIEKSGRKPLKIKAHFRLSEAFTALEDYVSAENVLDHAAKIADEKAVSDEVRYRLGWIYLLQDQIDRALEHFASVSAQNRYRFRIRKLETELQHRPLYPKKSPRLAGFLSIFPGAGFAYCERYRDAAVAFLLNSGLILASVKSFDNDNEALGAVIGFVGAGFYGGNIYGAVSSAHKYNRSSKKSFLDKLKARTGVTLSFNAEENSLSLGFSGSF